MNQTALLFTTTHSTTIKLSTTSLPNTTTNAGPTTTIQPALLHYRSQATIIIQVALLAALGVVIVLGNLASIVTFLKTQSLRRRCHYLLISLSVADFLVGINNYMTMYFFLTGPQFNLFIVSLEFVDTFTGTVSVLTLSVIAVERFHAIYFPFKHRMLRFKFYMCCIAFPWIAAAVISPLYLIGYFKQNTPVYEAYTYAIFIVASLALVIISSCYVSIGLKIKRKNPSAQSANRATKEKRLSVTLLIVTLASLVTWIPLQCFLFILYICKGCPFPHFNVLFIMKFLQFCNSGINVFIYIIRMPEFRAAFWRWLCKKETENVQLTNTDGVSSTRRSPSSTSIYNGSEPRNTHSSGAHARAKNYPTSLNQKNKDNNVQAKYVNNAYEEEDNFNNVLENKPKNNEKKKVFETNIKHGINNSGFTGRDVKDTKL